MAYAFGYGAHMGFGFGFLNFLGTILFIIAIVWFIKFFVRGGRGPWGGPWGRSNRWRNGHRDDALRTARERFAAGEITREQYDALRGGLEREAENGYGGPPHWFNGGDSAMELARMRFARGELTREEFETIRKGLTA